MKTIYTTLPIYNKLAKQCYERGRHAGFDTPNPIICPRHRLPSFQWLDDTDGAAHIDKIELINETFTGAASNGPTTWATHLNFDVSATPHFTHTLLSISDAKNDTSVGPDATATTDIFSILKNQHVRIRGHLTVVGGVSPTAKLGTSSQLLVDGDVDITLTAWVSNSSATVQFYTFGATEYSFTGVQIQIINSIDITTYFVSLPVLAHDYFTYDAATLNYLLPVGIYYLKIKTDNSYIYYSEWFKVDCVYTNLLTDPDGTATDYDHFTNVDTAITVAINDAGDGSTKSNEITNVFKGDILKCYFYLTNNAGELPKVCILDFGGSALSNEVNAVAGLNDITFTLTANATNTFPVLNFRNTTTSDWLTTEILLTRNYSTKYLTINFHNDCDFGDIYYHGGFDQTLWFKSEPMESVFPLEESGITNGEGQVIRTFARQTKKYIVRTDKMPDYMVDVFNRMRLHDFIELIDLVGDTNTVYNLEVEHEWLAPDRYYAQINLTFDYDETVVIGGCCNNIV
jgi:hypothetical protein